MNPNPPDAVGGVSPAAFASLFQAIGGLRNRRALLAMLGCLVAGVLVASVFSLLASRLGFVMGLFGAVAMFVASAAGINAAGVLLMDQARGVPSRALADAFVYGLLCIPKFIGLALLLVGVALAVFLVLAIVYLVCKIPVLGPMLFVVVFPLSVLISGLTLCGLFLCMLLALPSIWEGATITRALAQTLAIARSRGVEAILLLAVVGLLAGAVGIIVFGVLFTGLMPSAGLAASVFGGDGLGGMLGVASHRGDMAAIGDADTGSSYALAAGIGGALLWALAGSLISLVQLLGLNLVYLRVTEGLDLSAAEAALKARLDDAKRGAADLGQKARDAAERAREQARRSTGAAAQPSASTDATIPAVKPAEPPPAPPPRTGERSPRAMPPESTTPAVAKALTCPQCLSSVGAGDVYCGVCGHRLS